MAITAWFLEPFVMPWRYASTLERTSQPLIGAIDKYEADHGWPPEHEKLLIPAYLEGMPETGYRGCESFAYSCRRLPEDTHVWTLTVYCDPLASSDPPTLRFDSNDRVWRYHP